MKLRVWAVLAVLMALLAPGHAATKKLFAVLEFSGAKDVSVDDLQLLADSARAGVVEVLPASEYLVMTRESMVNVLRQMGKTCDNEGECEVDTLQNIGADYGVTGRASLVDGIYVVTLKLFDTRSGQLLATEKAKSKKRSTLVDEVELAAARMVRKTLSTASPGEADAEAPGAAPAVTASGPTIERAAATQATGKLSVETTPKQGVRLEVTDPSGKVSAAASPYRNPKAALGTWKLVARASGYAEESREVDVPPDQATVVSVTLGRLGGLDIKGKPAGANVRVNGPAAFHDEGGLPWKAAGLRAGSYTVEVTRDGYEPRVQEVVVEPGKTAAVSVDLAKASARPEDAAAREMLEGALQYIVSSEVCPVAEGAEPVAVHVHSAPGPGTAAVLRPTPAGSCWMGFKVLSRAVQYGARYRMEHRARLASGDVLAEGLWAEIWEPELNTESFHDVFPGALQRTPSARHMGAYDPRGVEAIFKKLYVKPSTTLAGVSAQRIYDGMLSRTVRAAVADVVAVLDTLAADQLDALARRYQRAADAEAFDGPSWLVEQAARVGLPAAPADPEDAAVQVSPDQRRPAILGLILRRRLDGTLPVLLDAIKTVLRDYDPETFKAVAPRLKAP